MNYELAKKLKDAGFESKQENTGDEYWIKSGNSYIENGVEYEEVVYKPTLSELIDACGGSFYRLIFNGVSWSSESIEEGNPRFREYGKTKEEAVAKLWLKLNEK